ncbi:MAG: putative sulfate exporter family transporter [Nitrospirota bacterium]|nr:putative sulfate exporter family transporter [Nitrospirota bacterium]
MALSYRDPCRIPTLLLDRKAFMPPSPRSYTGLSFSILPGLLLSSALAIFAYVTSELSRHLTGAPLVGPILVAILAGVLVRNLLPLRSGFDQGIRFSFRRLLRVGVVGLGFDFSAHDILTVGVRGMILDLAIVALVYGAALLLGQRRGLSNNLALLLGTGTAICGASAIVAANSVIRAKDEEVAFSVATVTIFGTLSMFLFPLANRFLHLSDIVYGAWAGSSIHEVGQVIGATLPYSQSSLQLGTILKLTRVALLLPVILLLESILLLRSKVDAEGKSGHPGQFPWFVLGFAGVVVLNFLLPLPPLVLSALKAADTGILAVSMAAMGLETHLSRLVHFGWKPVRLGISLWIFVSVAGLLLSSLLYGHV